MNTKVEVLVNNKSIKQYSHEGRTFVEAKIGSEYSIKVKNNSACRKLAVITVDGINVISGQPQSDTSAEVGQGYVIDAYNSIDIKGFRSDKNTVGAFKFCQSGLSYSKEKGLKNNNGVIGVRVYDEQVPFLSTIFTSTKEPQKLFDYETPHNPWTYGQTPCVDKFGDSIITSCSLDCRGVDDSPSSALRGSSNVSCNYSSAPNFDAGTTWGNKIQDSVSYTNFKPSAFPEEFVIYYDVRKNLKKIGISFENKKNVNYPKAFGAFATPPKGWEG